MLRRQYEILVRGQMPGALLEELADHQIEAQTLLSGRLRDQAELHGILLRLHNLGLELLEMRQYFEFAMDYSSCLRLPCLGVFDSGYARSRGP